jgi:hypothetical protein
MNITKLNRKDLEIGDSCLLQVTVEAKEEGSWVQFRTTGNSPAFVLADFEDSTFYAFSPENGTKNTEPPPKYDPNRKFKAGDIVEIDPHGRDVTKSLKNATVALGKRYTVIKDERIDGFVSFEDEEGKEDLAMFFWLKLLVPVEELERYIVIHNDCQQSYDVCWKDDATPNIRIYHSRCRASYWYHYPPQTYTQKEAKEAAEAECARLNAEYRKEQNND